MANLSKPPKLIKQKVQELKKNSSLNTVKEKGKSILLKNKIHMFQGRKPKGKPFDKISMMSRYNGKLTKVKNLSLFSKKCKKSTLRI